MSPLIVAENSALIPFNSLAGPFTPEAHVGCGCRFVFVCVCVPIFYLFLIKTR